MANVRAKPVAPIAATVLSAIMVALPGSYGAARVLQYLVVRQLARDSLPLAVLINALIVGVITFGVYAMFAFAGSARAGNFAAALVFGIYAIVFFAWVVGPFIG